MRPSPSPLLSARQIAQRCALLPCAGCGAPGSHRVSTLPGGAYEARCERCRDLREAQVAEEVAQEIADVLHSPALVEVES